MGKGCRARCCIKVERPARSNYRATILFVATRRTGAGLCCVCVSLRGCSGLVAVALDGQRFASPLVVSGFLAAECSLAASQRGSSALGMLVWLAAAGWIRQTMMESTAPVSDRRNSTSSGIMACRTRNRLWLGTSSWARWNTGERRRGEDGDDLGRVNKRERTSSAEQCEGLSEFWAGTERSGADEGES